MIDKQLIAQTVEEALASTDAFLVDVRVSGDNNVVVEIDSPTGIDIDTCAEITRLIESRFDRDVEDYELEVGSAGLTAPLKVRGQYLKNIGNEMEVLTADGRKIYGTLTAVAPDFSTYTLLVPEKVKVEGKKRPEIVEKELTLPVDGTKSIKYSFKFK